MRNNHRREHIMERLSTAHRVTVSELVDSLHVSDETVRRDLKDLEAEGLLRRVHGGAINLAPIRDEPINNRSQKAAKEKRIISQLAVTLISDRTSIFLDTGSTTLSLAKQLGEFSDLKLYTNSLHVAQAARDHFGVSIYITPGQLRKVELDLVGYDTIKYIQNFYFDIAFMGSAGISVERGFMDFEEDEARVRQALIESSRNRVVLADSSKFGKTANIRTMSFGSVDQLVTERHPEDTFMAEFTRNELEVVHA